MSTVNVSDTTINVGPTNQVVEAARELAKAAKLNAEAILEIARALAGPNQATGVYVGGDSYHTHAPEPWKGQGFYPAENREDAK